MTIDDLKRDLSDRLGRRVEAVLTREGESAQEMSDLYQPSPAGFAGRLICRDGTRLAWELWLEDGDRWNFHATELAEASPQAE